MTVLSASHSGAMRYHEEAGEQFDHGAHEDRQWLMAVKPVEKQLVVAIRGRLREFPVFVPVCPCRVEPVNGVPQGPTKVRVTTDKSWPKREIEIRDLSANAWMDLDALGKVKFPRTAKFAAAAAIIGCAEPSADASPEVRAAAAAAEQEHRQLELAGGRLVLPLPALRSGGVGGGSSTIAASVARLVWAAVRGVPSWVGVSVVFQGTFPGVSSSGSVEVGVVIAGGTVMEAPLVIPGSRERERETDCDGRRVQPPTSENRPK